MCDKTILENGGVLKPVCNCYKNQRCDKDADNYPHTSKSVLDSYKTLKMCDKAVNTHPSTT